VSLLIQLLAAEMSLVCVFFFSKLLLTFVSHLSETDISKNFSVFLSSGSDWSRGIRGGFASAQRQLPGARLQRPHASPPGSSMWTHRGTGRPSACCPISGNTPCLNRQPRLHSTALGLLQWYKQEGLKTSEQNNQSIYRNVHLLCDNVCS